MFPQDGGYVAELDINKNVTLAIITELESLAWLDANTRVLILDFPLYNANANKFCHVSVVGEVSLSGAVLMSCRVSVFPMSLYLHGPVSVVVMCQALFLLVIILIFVNLCWELWSTKCRAMATLHVILNVIFVVLAVYTVVVYVIRQVAMEKATTHLRNYPRRYVSFGRATTANEATMTGLSILLFLATIKLLVSLKFIPHVYRFGCTLSRLMKSLFLFAIECFSLYFALVHFSYLTFGAYSPLYKSVSNSAIALLTTSIETCQIQCLIDTLSYVGRFYMLLWFVGINVMCIGVLVSIIIDALSQAKQHPNKKYDDINLRVCSHMLEKAAQLILPCRGQRKGK